MSSTTDSVHHAALEYLRGQLAGARQEKELVQLNVTVGPSTRATAERLSTELDWTKRKVIETALAMLDMWVAAAKEQP